MKHLKITFSILVIALAFCSSVASAHHARGAAIAPEALDAQTRASLSNAIRAARAQDPAPFDNMVRLSKLVVTLDAQKRGRLAPVKRMFLNTGKAGVLPMIELLAFEGPIEGTMPKTAWIALRAGTIEALGHMRDSRVMPVLYAILDSNETEYYLVRATTEAIGRMADDKAVSTLQAAATDPAKRFAVLAAIGYCRRAETARFLANELAKRPALVTAKMLVGSLSDVGNSYAWKLDVVRTRGNGDLTRAIAATALVKAFLAYDGEVRQAASNALMVVDSPNTTGLIDAARHNASVNQRTALDKLAARFARNPVRRR